MCDTPKCAQADTGCLFYLNSDCVSYKGAYIPGFDIKSGDSFTLVIQKITGYIGSTTTTTTTHTTSSTTTTTTTVVYDTNLTFVSDTYAFAEGVSGQSISTNAVLKLEFNKVTNPVGLYTTMVISVGGNPVLQVTYRTEYTGHIFRFTHTNGVKYNGTFGSNVNF